MQSREDVGPTLTALEDYYQPARNIIFERCIFGICKQEDDNRIDGFVTRLRDL